MLSDPIQLFITGGTIDKQYQETSGELVFPDSHLPTLLDEANSGLEIRIETLMQKDSLDMNDQDRAAICQACLQTPSKKIVITHGTDTMTQTAQSLQNFPELQSKTIVLTGAMRPFMLGHSDASFNVGSALMAVQIAPAGIYIAMNGRLFTGDNVVKNREIGRFEPVETK